MPDPFTAPAHPSQIPAADVAVERHVFVYGTLRRGDDNDITRLQPAPRFVGDACVLGTLYHLGRYPGLVLQGATPVKGEVYAVTPALERVLDEIEEIYPQQTDEYFKRVIPVSLHGTSVECIVYEINPVYINGKPVLPGGDWVMERGHMG